MTDSNGVKNDSKSEALCQKIHSGQDENLQIYGFERSPIKTFFTYLSIILTVGGIRLLFHWYPHLYLYATHRKCPLRCATKLLIIDDYQGKYKSYFVKDVKLISSKHISSSLYATLSAGDRGLVEKIKDRRLRINLENGTQCEVSEYKAFWCKKQCYIWDVTQSVFSKLVGLDKYTLCSDLHLRQDQGLSKEEQFLRRIVYGNNDIVVPVQSIGVLLLLEILNPFYIFQIFTLCVWFAEGYLYYTGAIVCMSFFGITSSIIQTRRNQTNLRGTVASSETVRVRRGDGVFEQISSSELVPGDIIELPKHQGLVVCDAVLLTGQCIVNESMLTGESVPVTKTALPSRHVLYDSKECSHHTIYSGTTIIQTRCYGDGPVLARVIRTGLHTNRGALVAAILYPPPADFKFDQDSYKFIGILACIATCGFIYTVVTKVSRGITASDIAIKALDIITIVIPPALPAAMTVGKLYAQARLKQAQIYCINSRVINVSGSINCVCFDKTGTLTEDGLDMWGVVPCTNGALSESEREVPKLKNHPLFEGMLVCHSLTQIDGELCGDPLDVKMFESTGWTLEEPDMTQVNGHDIVAPTVVRPPKDSLAEHVNEIPDIAYTKGSPEMILSLSKPESVPPDIMFALKRYTEQGYRVIAMGRSIINENGVTIPKLSRDAIETNLEFLGLVILENRLKKPTITVIKELREAKIQVVMITGDNIQTAVSVAKECGILLPEETVIDVTVVLEGQKAKPEIFFSAQGLTPRMSLSSQKFATSLFDAEEGYPKSSNYRFALTGQTWQLLREFYPDLVPRICVRGAIFARMTSDQKQQLVMELMQLGYYVAMCGDGANDCGALRAAHAGVSLSEAESSVASPFTSRVPDITCVPKVIREGRAALVTSFGIFKFMVAYSLTEFLSVIILYSMDSNLTDIEFLFIDICLIVNFAFFFGKTKAYEKKLAKKPPMTSLLSFTPIFSITIHMVIMTIFQTIAYHTVREFPWFTPFKPTTEHAYTCYENYSVYCVSMFQYITMAIIFSRGKPYRRAIYTNGAFMCSILLLVAICTYITVYPAQWIVNVLELLVPPVYDWRLIIIVLAFANFLLCFAIEMFVVEYVIERKLREKLYRPEKSSKKYLKVEYELSNCRSWPKLNTELPVLPITPSVENIIKATCAEDIKYFDGKAISSKKVKTETTHNRTDDERNDVEYNGLIDKDESQNQNMITRF